MTGKRRHSLSLKRGLAWPLTIRTTENSKNASEKVQAYDVALSDQFDSQPSIKRLLLENNCAADPRMSAISREVRQRCGTDSVTQTFKGLRRLPLLSTGAPRVLSPLTSSTFVVPILVSFHGELLRRHCHGPF
jgi:hypothetical protein